MQIEDIFNQDDSTFYICVKQ